jgi:histone deacetylase complex regulatory component SIN3
VAHLFKNHNDLLEEFTYFLPDATPPALQSGPVRKITARARQYAAARSKTRPYVDRLSNDFPVAASFLLDVAEQCA